MIQTQRFGVRMILKYSINDNDLEINYRYKAACSSQHVFLN